MKFELNHERMGPAPKGSDMRTYTAKVGRLITVDVYSIGPYWAYDIRFLGARKCSQLAGKVFDARELAEERAIERVKELLAEAMADLESEG